MNIFHVFQSGDFVLIATFLLLVGMSVVSWSVIINKVLTLKKEERAIAEFEEKHKTPQEIVSSLSVSSSNEKHHLCIQNFVKCVNNSKKLVENLSHEEAKEILTMNLIQTLDKEKTVLDSGLSTLASIANSAPFIGLFGTVWGIYNALLEISSQGNAGLSIVAGPMGEALVATAFGLFVAIPAGLGYNIFARKNKIIVQSLRHVAEKLTIYSTKKWQ